jgi:transposase
MKPSAKRRAQLQQAAEWHAGGLNWDAIAAKLNVRSETVRAWAEQCSDWPALVQQAERQQAQSARNEALTVLRQLLRSADDKVRRDAAKHLLGRPTSPRPPTVPATDAHRVQAYVAALDDAAVRQLLAELGDTPSTERNS